jgi:predicted DNA-binding transcriptional regulator AlpA
LEVKTQIDPLLTEQQVSELLGLKPGTLQVWRCNKRYPLAYVKIGRNVRYRESAVRAFLDVRTEVA